MAEWQSQKHNQLKEKYLEELKLNPAVVEVIQTHGAKLKDIVVLNEE